jgi:hypothetical protein
MSTPIEKVIDIRELRIGNYLLYEGKIVHVTMLSCDIDDEYQEQICFCELGKDTDEKGGWNRSVCDKLERIAITPEILKRLGFESTGSGDDNHSQILWQHPLTKYFYCEDGCMVYNGSHYDDWHDIGDIEYLHQLQNLFFAITNNELAIKDL